MRKLFFTICFISSWVISSTAYSAIREIIDEEDFNKIKSEQVAQRKRVSQIKDDVPTDRREFIKYIRERAAKAVKTSLDSVEGNSGMSIVHSDEYIAQQAQEGKTSFQKMYEEALNRVGLDEYNNPDDIIRDDASQQQQMPSNKKLRSQEALETVQKKKREFDFDIITITLPNGETVQAPAKEHIPYLASKIEILPDGLVRIRETVMVIANGEKLKYGLTKALPKYSISRDGVRNSTIPYLNGVKINGSDIDYVLRDNFDRFLITPKNRLPLQSGIYTYEFDYILDRKLWYYKDFNEFYWDATGSFWNLAITNAIATVRLPMNVQPLGQTLMVGYLPNDITEAGTVITYNKNSGILGFASEYPMFAGEGMFILIRIPKKGFIDPDFGKKFKWAMEDYGAILFALLGLLAIFTAYYISWKYIDKSAKDASKIKFERTSPLNRLLAKNKFDKISFGAYLLEMYRRGVINIVKDERGINITKRSNSLSNIDGCMRKVMKILFRKKETNFVVSHDTAARLNDAGKVVEKNTRRRLACLIFKLNLGYILLSGAMLILTELAIAYLNVNMWPVFGTLIKTSILAVLCFGVLTVGIGNKYLRIALRILAVVGLIIIGLYMYNYIRLISTILIMAMIYTMFAFSRKFMAHDGLIRHNIAEAQALEKKLKDSASSIILGNQFAANQPNIFALEAVDAYTRTPQVEIIYRLDLVKEIVDVM